MSDQRPLDIVLFGATGFTGGLVLEYLAQCPDGPGLRWAVAGRNADKLRACVQGKGALACPPIEQIVADSADETSLRAMAQKTRVIISTVGPYAQYGERLVKVCAEEGTDYVDLTGEPDFVALTRKRYHDTAVRTGARIVHACGFDSVPHDLGAHFTLQRLLEKLPEGKRSEASIVIEGFVKAKGTFSGGTWHSAVGAMADMRKQRALHKPSENARRDATRRVSEVKPSIRYRPELSAWAVPLPTIDPQIVLRSARAMESYGKSFQYGHYVALRNVAQVAGLLAGVAGIFVLAQLPPTRNFLLSFKDPGDGPDAETRARSWFKVTFLGRAGDAHVRCEVSGGDPGYGETAKMLAESALCLALDRDRLSEATGVATTAAVMAVPLTARLMRAGITFSEI